MSFIENWFVFITGCLLIFSLHIYTYRFRESEAEKFVTYQHYIQYNKAIQCHVTCIILCLHDMYMYLIDF